jgi:hypothetical protein
VATKKSIPGVHSYKKYYFVNLTKMFTEESYPKEAQINETFEEELTLRLSDGESIP